MVAHLSADMHAIEACRPLLPRVWDLMQMQAKGQRQNM